MLIAEGVLNTDMILLLGPKARARGKTLREDAKTTSRYKTQLKNSRQEPEHLMLENKRLQEDRDKAVARAIASVVKLCAVFISFIRVKLRGDV